MSVPQSEHKVNNLIPFGPPHLRRQVGSIVKNYRLGRITRAQMNLHIALTLGTPGRSVNLGSYTVTYTQDVDAMPVIIFQGWRAEHGRCPVCGSEERDYLAGQQGTGIDWFCMSCGAVYSTRGWPRGRSDKSPGAVGQGKGGE